MLRRGLVFCFVTVVFVGSVNAQIIKSAQKCKECHAKNYNEWSISYHHNSTPENNPFFDAMLKLSFPDSNQVKSCEPCHKPVQRLNVPSLLRQNLANEGVTCDVCHAAKLSGHSDSLFTIQPGNVKYGPYKDAVSAVHESEFSKKLTSSEFCLSCHGKKENRHGMIMCSTEEEYKKSSYAKDGVTCQDCHMPAIEGKTADLGKMRDEIYSHTFYGGHSEQMLRECAEINLESSREAEGFILTVDITNVIVGHSLPTGTPLRAVYLSVTAQDTLGETAWRNYQTNPIHEDPDAVFMRLLEDENGIAPAAPWSGVKTRFDQRLGANETRRLEYVIPDTSMISVEATLYYRLAPPGILKQAGITDEHYLQPVEITRARLELD